MDERFMRTGMLFKEEGMEKLKNSKVLIFGLGGVGGYVVEALARSSVGHFTIVDNDTVSITNINRQIIAVSDTVGRYKTDVMEERILSINPKAEVEKRTCFYLPENADTFDFSAYDYVVDAIDTVTAKLDIITRAKANNIKVISSMGTGNKTDPARLKLTDIYKTEGDPLARVMRRELKKRGIKSLDVVYSDELPMKPDIPESELMSLPEGKRSIPGSTAFVPPSAGLLIASHVVRKLLGG